MKNWKRLLACMLACSGFMGTTDVAGVLPPHAEARSLEIQAVQGIETVTSIAKVYGDGEKVAEAVLEYPKALLPDAVSPSLFAAEGKTIEAVCVNDRPEWTEESHAGPYVILKFAYENTAYDGDLSQRPGRQERAQEPRGKDAPMRSDRQLPDLSLQVRQVGSLSAVDGTVYSPSHQLVESTRTVEPELEKFQQFTYTDQASGMSMPYNLYLPPDYDASRKYPLLFFVADASANINEVRTPLFQGNGATVWASPEEQAKHECIVLAPQYTADLVEQLGMMTTDENVWTPGLSLVSQVLFDVIDRYSVDENRIYGTGQSQGGMTNIALSDKYPDLFAGQLLVACQWNVDEMEAMKDKHLWIVVCEGDTKAFPGMNAATERWESLGSKVARNADFWDSKAPAAELDEKVRAMESADANIYYTVFQGGNHMYTWSFAYNIGAIRDWLFRQEKAIHGQT